MTPTETIRWMFSRNIFGLPFSLFLGVLAYSTIACAILTRASKSGPYIGAGITILTISLFNVYGWTAIVAVGVVLTAITILVVSLRTGTGYAYGTLGPNAPHQSHQQINPSILYHGTSIENAFEIYDTKLWLVGKAVPRGIYLTDDFTIAKSYAGRKGGIVVVSPDPNLKFNRKGKHVFVYEVTNPQPNQEYYAIQGLNPTAILSPNGTTIV